MDDVARSSSADRDELFTLSASARGLPKPIIEKDFWVCWILARLFGLPDPPAGLVFKGGTSLSKIWGLIDRFSEDVDLSIDRADLGFAGQDDPKNIPSKKKRQEQLDALAAACAAAVQNEFRPKLEQAIAASLGTAPGEGWQLVLDPDDQQALRFQYPASAPSGPDAVETYVRPFVKLEMGARSEPWPSHTATIKPFAAEDVPRAFSIPSCNVMAVDAERTLWEKVTILHRWHHAGPDRHLRDRQSRHYYDVYRIAASSIGTNALGNLDLLRAVARHADEFFPQAWARYGEAVPGTLRLIPPPEKIRELEKDYGVMREEMIYGDAPSLDEILEGLRRFEEMINAQG